jgi:predicted RNA binding protein YcfA (HicA-like mRNA interferase family)
MPQLPVLSGRDVRRAFERAGWHFARQRGSHMILVKPGVPVNLSIPIIASLTADFCAA